MAERHGGYPAWLTLTDEQREMLLAHDQLVCRRCGNLRSVCSDPTIDWHAHVDTCWPSATVDWGRRRLREIHDKDDMPDGALRRTDGVAVFPSTFEPDDDPLA